MDNSKNISIVALVCGVLGVIGAFTYTLPLLTWILFLCAIAGIVFGAIGMSKSKKESGNTNGLAIAGLVCGIVGVVFGISGVICASCICAVAGPLGCLNPDYVALANAANEIANYANALY